MRPVAVLAAVVGLFAHGCVQRRARGRVRHGTERVFLQTCTQGDAGLSEELCSCTYERITRTIPFDEYAEIDRQVRDDPDALPDRIADIAAACAARIVAGGGSGISGRGGSRRRRRASARGSSWTACA